VDGAARRQPGDDDDHQEQGGYRQEGVAVGQRLEHGAPQVPTTVNDFENLIHILFSSAGVLSIVSSMLPYCSGGSIMAELRGRRSD